MNQSDGGCTQIVDVSGLVAILGNPFLNLVVAQRFPRIIWNGPHAAAAGRRAVCCPTQYRGPRGRAGRSVRRCRRRRWRAVPTGAGSRSRSAGILARSPVRHTKVRNATGPLGSRRRESLLGKVWFAQPARALVIEKACDHRSRQLDTKSAMRWESTLNRARFNGSVDVVGQNLVERC
jgi:hypothetical protein